MAARKVSVGAATLMSLACGTNYIYSAWAPQFADHLELSSTQSNLIAVWSLIGVYASGIPFGLLVDTYGPRFLVLPGACLLGIGYYMLYLNFNLDRNHYHGVPVNCFYALLTGLGSSAAFFSAIKVSALNWPHNRGTATAFPLAAFGLSAFFFSSLASYGLRADTSTFLLTLSIGTFTLISIPFFFLRVIPTLEDQPAEPPRKLERTIFEERLQSEQFLDTPQVQHDTEGERSSLLSTSSTVSDYQGSNRFKELPDVRGWRLVRSGEFWRQWISMACLAGVGLMTINNIGNDVQALWRYYDDSVNDAFLQSEQRLHVSVLSVCSFIGRLITGVGSDYLVNSLGTTRHWCVVASGATFAVAQFIAVFLDKPQALYLVSGINGLGYGALFGFFVSLVSEAFGIQGLSQNWGIICLAPVVSANLFDLIYGVIYDAHSEVGRDGHMHCPEGLACYRSAYLVTLVASLAGLALGLYSVALDRRKRKKSRLSHTMP